MREKFFNTAGPIQKDIHYYLDPLSRWNLEEILHLIQTRKYFVLHAPRQTGKTTGLFALMDYLNDSGDYHAVYANIETAQTARNDIKEGMHTILSEIANQVSWFLKDSYLMQIWKEVFASESANSMLRVLLSEWCQQTDKPVVLLLDEVDALVGDTLISLLRQLRSGYSQRPGAFPQTIILCGVRDVRDYRIHSASTNEIITGGSAFNIKSESLTLGNFSMEEIANLYQEHTLATGQTFGDGVLDKVWRYTAGQPYLVNALAYEACFRKRENRDRLRMITVDDIEMAKESLIMQRVTHLDQLTDKLKEERVRRVVEPILKSVDFSDRDLSDNDVQYCIDLGIISPERPLKVANDIYKEIIPRDLIYATEYGISHEQVWYIEEDGSLNIHKLIAAFGEFFRENSEHWIERFQYKEAGPQLLLQAFLQRIINGGGLIDREYGLGKMRTDLFIRWFFGDSRFQGREQKIVIECKMLHKSLESTLKQGLQQTAAYMDRCGSQEGHLIIFDRTPGKSWDDKIWQRQERASAYDIAVWGM